MATLLSTAEIWRSRHLGGCSLKRHWQGRQKSAIHWGGTEGILLRFGQDPFSKNDPESELLCTCMMPQIWCRRFMRHVA